MIKVFILSSRPSDQHYDRNASSWERRDRDVLNNAYNRDQHQWTEEQKTPADKRHYGYTHVELQRRENSTRGENSAWNSSRGENSAWNSASPVKNFAGDQQAAVSGYRSPIYPKVNHPSTTAASASASSTSANSNNDHQERASRRDHDNGNIPSSNPSGDRSFHYDRHYIAPPRWDRERNNRGVSDKPPGGDYNSGSPERPRRPPQPPPDSNFGYNRKHDADHAAGAAAYRAPQSDSELNFGLQAPKNSASTRDSSYYSILPPPPPVPPLPPNTN